MTSKFFAAWFKKHREEGKLTLKEVHKRFNEHIKKIGKPHLKRSYGWFTGLEKYAEFADKELDMLSILADFFGYSVVLVPKDVEITNEIPDAMKIITEENKDKEKGKEKTIRDNIVHKGW